MDVANMKVAELRSALESRGLDSTGKKQELQERLRAALEHEADLGWRGQLCWTTAGTWSDRATGLANLRPRRLRRQTRRQLGAQSRGAKIRSPRLQAEGLSAQEEEDEKGAKKLTDEELEEFLSPSEREEVAKTKARASRFGVPYTGLPVEMRRAALSRYHKRRRFERMLERHGGLVPVDDAEEERRRKRMERFGLPKPVLELEAEERERQSPRAQSKENERRARAPNGHGNKRARYFITIAD
ncbi:hypothetical protein F1559_003542 [Cyanidiococcus yangmingshanensis]|uniref:SAP domain-containing protein n=1 Tax=Cyanidiococcus yangmingshanensis TaxID=2690220 RepID=A0A7J7IJ08_9RHOD|nr:hypothetical protein F1559_003542 [Cyanidiococcus yangmingshanensis]